MKNKTKYRTKKYKKSYNTRKNRLKGGTHLEDKTEFTEKFQTLMNILRRVKKKNVDIISELTEAKTLCSELIRFINEKNVNILIKFKYNVGKPVYHNPVPIFVKLDVFNYLTFLLPNIEEKIKILNPNQENQHRSDVSTFFGSKGLPTDILGIVYGNLNTTVKEMKTRNPNNKTYIGTINDQIDIYTFKHRIKDTLGNGYNTREIDVTYTPDTPYDIIYQRKITNANHTGDRFFYVSGWKPVD
jgi:hypothetical protein